MSNAQAARTEPAKTEPYKLAIADAQSRFAKVNTARLDFQAEALFALQACNNNGFLADIANKNPLSLSMAVANVAAIGLTLNPVMGYAFLIPRDGKVILDISYRGLIKIATDIGSIKWAKAELVYSKDRFLYRGPAHMPEHAFDPFEEDRGEFRGVYCIAKTADNDILVEAIKAAEIYKIRDCSDYYSKKKQGPWVDWFGEKAKISAIKRGSKTWPKTAQDERLAEAIRILNEDAGDGLADLVPQTPTGQSIQLNPVGQAPSESEISEKTSDFVKKLIARGRKDNAWQSVKAYANEKLKGVELNYALHQIAQAEPKAQQAAATAEA